MVRDEEWKKDFQNGLTAIQQLVEKLGEKLDAEIDTRQKDVLELRDEQFNLKSVLIPVTATQKKYHFLLTTIASIGSAILAGLVVYFFTASK
jgi:hypothetical protein